MEEPETEEARLSRENQDREYAEMLQAKEQAKLKRAKERAKLKKQQQRQQQHHDVEGEHHQRQHSGDYSHHQPHSGDYSHHHERALSQPLSLVSVGQVSGGRTESRQSRRSECGALQNGRHSRTSANSRSFEEDVRPPARRPYMNPGKDKF